MKIKTKEIRRKLKPNMENVFHRVHNQDLLYNKLSRRMNWRFDVLESCDNYKEIFKADDCLDFDCIIFPSRRRLSKRIGTIGYIHQPNHNVFHIIRQGKRKWRIVKCKSVAE